MRIPLNTFMCITETKINRQVLDSLLMAYSSEWYAYNQYWNGALLATGKTREILLEHSKDEMKHLGWIAKRILELGGGLHECLEEVNLLLTHICVQTSVNSELTYKN